MASMVNLGMYELLAHPDQLAALVEDIKGGGKKGLLKGAVEEMCRYHTASALALRRWGGRGARAGRGGPAPDCRGM